MHCLTDLFGTYVSKYVAKEETRSTTHARRLCENAWTRNSARSCPMLAEVAAQTDRGLAPSIYAACISCWNNRCPLFLFFAEPNEHREVGSNSVFAEPASQVDTGQKRGPDSESESLLRCCPPGALHFRLTPIAPNHKEADMKIQLIQQHGMQRSCSTAPLARRKTPRYVVHRWLKGPTCDSRQMPSLVFDKTTLRTCTIQWSSKVCIRNQSLLSRTIRVRRQLTLTGGTAR